MRSTNRQHWQREQRDNFTILEIMHVLWSRRLLVAGTVAALASVVLAYSLLQERVYVAEAVVNVDSRQALRAGEAPGTLLGEITTAVDTAELRQEARQEAGWGGEAGQFGRQLNVEPFGNQGGETGLLVQFSAPDPEEASRVANIYAELLVERIQQLGDRQAGVTLAAEAGLASEAVPPGRPSGPHPLLFAALAVVGGLLAGGGHSPAAR